LRRPEASGPSKHSIDTDGAVPVGQQPRVCRSGLVEGDLEIEAWCDELSDLVDMDASRGGPALDVEKDDRSSCIDPGIVKGSLRS
jgi:hypothetical protein